MAQIKAILAEKGGVANAETTDNKVTSLSSSSTDTQYPSAKAVYNELQDIDGANVTVTVPEEFTNPLNTDQLTAGQHDVYFTAYPDIMWHVDHVDGDYVYLGLYTITETTPFRSSGSSYSGSTIASKCTTYLNNTIPNVAQYLEDVTVEGVTAKVFIPTYYQFSGNTGYGDTSGPVFTYIANASFDTRKTIISNDWTQNPPNYGVWLSTAYNSSYVWNAYYNGSIAYGPPSGTSRTLGFRPEVKVRYKVDPVIKDLNTAIGDINTALADKQNKLTFDTAPTAGSTNPVTSDGVKIYVDSSYTIAGQKSGTTLGTKATAEGSNTTASGIYSHAEGTYTTASGQNSHAEGIGTLASGISSHAEGNGTTAQRKAQHVIGECNVLDTTGSTSTRGQYVEIVGNGTSDSARSNARTLDWSGNETLAGKLTLGAAPTANMDAATKQYVDNSVQNIDASNVVVTEEFTNPLNTDQLTAGQHDVYFTAYPSIKWHVDHIDGDYVYLGLYTITETTQFGSSTTYSGSTIASKCTTFLNNTIPNVADYLESVTVENVTNKVFIPTYYQMSGKTGYGDTSGPVFTNISSMTNEQRKGIISNDWTQNPPNHGVWLSSPYDSSGVWIVTDAGNFNAFSPSNSYGFRPEVKVRYKVSSTDLNTVISDINASITKTKISGTSILGPTLYVASSDPTSSDGTDGDFWFVYEE